MLKTVTSITDPVNHTHLPLRTSLAPSVRPLEFKGAMAKLTFSISIVTACHRDERLGRTVTSLMPVSAEPPHIMVSIDVRSRLIDLIGLSGRFSISFLAAGQEKVADAFAGKHPGEDRFSIADWDYWPSGNLRLANAAVGMDCELVGSLDTGDHMLFVGAVTETEMCDTSLPLLWNERNYCIPNTKVSAG